MTNHYLASINDAIKAAAKDAGRYCTWGGGGQFSGSARIRIRVEIQNFMLKKFKYEVM